jgi:hypothetical protein
MNITFLCNPNNEDGKVRAHHMSEFFSDELDDVEKRALPERYKSKSTLIMLIASSNCLFQRNSKFF